MRDVTKDELKEYFRFTYKDELAADFSQPQAELIGETAQEARVLQLLSHKANEARERGISASSFMLSAWVSAFQMGREFESRLALKSSKAPGSAPEPAATAARKRREERRERRRTRRHGR